MAGVLQGKKLRSEVIVKAAFEEFLESGYERARMERIAQRAGIGKSTIYEYFPSKKDLLLETVEETFRFIESKIQEILLVQKPFREKVREFFIKGYDSIPQDAPDSYSMNRIWESVRHVPECQMLIKEREQNLTAVFQKAMEQAAEQGEIRKNFDVEALLLWMRVLVMTIVIQSKPMPAEKIEAILDLLFEGLTPRN